MNAPNGAGALREKILAAKDIDERLVEVPEWDVSVLVRTLTARQRAGLLQDAVDGRGRTDLQKLYSGLVVACCLDPLNSEPIFKEGDADAIAGKSGVVVERLAQAAMQISAMTGAAAMVAEKN